MERRIILGAFIVILSLVASSAWHCEKCSGGLSDEKQQAVLEINLPSPDRGTAAEWMRVLIKGHPLASLSVVGTPVPTRQ